MIMISSCNPDLSDFVRVATRCGGVLLIGARDRKREVGELTDLLTLDPSTALNQGSSSLVLPPPITHPTSFPPTCGLGIFWTKPQPVNRHLIHFSTCQPVVVVRRLPSTPPNLKRLLAPRLAMP